MERIETRDGSITFWSEEFNEAYHSKTVGALEEATVKYVEPALIKNGDVVLDFCFGLGYNTLAALMKVDKIKIIAIEKDPKIIEKINEITVPTEFSEKFEIIRELVKANLYQKNGIDIKLIIGDGIEEIKKLGEMFDTVLFDPFSPKVHPEMWSQEVFDDIAKIMKKGGRLTTYSCARHVREKLRNSGFRVEDGPCFGRKSPSTIGIKD